MVPISSTPRRMGLALCRTFDIRPLAMRFLLLLIVCSLFISCRRKAILSDFKSDGCSLFPDSSLITKDDWCDCCYAHDLAYWKGGTQAERLAADEAFRACILEKTGDEALAEIMFQGVRFGGSPYFYNWYRWGYGWKYGRMYAPLNEQEQSQVAEKLKSLTQKGAVAPCL